MDDLRRPLFIAALALIALVVLLELGADWLLPVPDPAALSSLIPADDAALREAYAELDADEVNAILGQAKPPGLAIRYLALMDGILLFTLGLMAVGMVIGPGLHGRIHGIVTLVVAILLLLAAIGLVLTVALPRLLLMVALFFSAPFGTLAYLAIYGFFNRGGATVLLSLLMTLKLGFVVCLVLAQQRMLQNKGLVLMIFTSLLAMVIISLLHGLVPLILVSITDAIAAIIVALLAAIWAVVMLIFSISAVIKALRPN
jgi:hypothetical protein